jgi:hypothetical protein
MGPRGTRIAAVLLALVGATAFAAVDEGSDVAIDFRKSVNLSAAETQAQAKDYLKKMQETQRRVQMLQTKAKKDKDMVKLNCVNDKLTQLTGHMTVTNQSMGTLALDIAKGDDTARQHEFTRVSILYQKVVTLGTEEEQCIGEDVSYVGATRVDVEIDPSIPASDPTEPPPPYLAVPDRPPPASPFV